MAADVVQFQNARDVHEGMRRLLAAGNVAEVFEWGFDVVKLYRSEAAKPVAFREAAIHAAVEALGLPVPTVLGVQQIGGRWGVVFERINQASFADQMREDPAILSRYLGTLARLHARIHAHPAPDFGSLKVGSQETSPTRTFSASRESGPCCVASPTCRTATAYATAISRADVVVWLEDNTSRQRDCRRALSVLSSMLRHAETLGLRPEGSNPCAGLRRRSSQFKARYLSDEEFHRLGLALDQVAVRHPVEVALIRFLMLTGARRGEALALKWSAIEGPRAVLRDSKTDPRSSGWPPRSAAFWPG